jgi:signal transduction histidine kinase
MDPEATMALDFDAIFPDAATEGYALDFLFEHSQMPLFEMRMQCQRQSPTYVLGSSVRLTDSETGAPILACTFSDISARKEQEQETRNALQVVSDQNNRLLNFSYIVSHNIRSHSSNISGFTHLLDEELRNESADRRELMEALLKSSQMLDTTLRHLNDLLNMQSKHQIVHETLNVREMVNNTLNILAAEIKSLKVQVTLSIAENVELRTDRVYFESMLLNLISNAIKYRKPDVIPELEVQAFKDAQGVHIGVCDNGLGIDLERHSKRLFGMFKTFHGNPEALGIGLFITRNQVESLGGKITVESALGKGSVFRVLLP